MAFFETPRFPDDISYNSKSITSYKTDITEMTGGSESRLARWADARRSYDAVFGVRTVAQLESLLSFFHSCYGSLHGFRFNDPTDNSSTSVNSQISETDQIILPIGSSTVNFQLRKKYNAGTTVYRDIKKPVAGSVIIAIAGVPQSSGWTVDNTTGIVTFSTPPVGTVTAGFLFDVPCRFSSDSLDTNMISYRVINTSVQIIEIKV